MLRLVVQRVLALVPLLLIVSVLTFSLTSLLPADPADLIIGDQGTEEQRKMVRERLGLNEPVVTRYFHWVGRAARGISARPTSTVSRWPMRSCKGCRSPFP